LTPSSLRMYFYDCHHLTTAMTKSSIRTPPTPRGSNIQRPEPPFAVAMSLLLLFELEPLLSSELRTRRQ
jgi:hypothetical protein